MWYEFLVAVIFDTLVLYLPGFFLLKSLRLPCVLSIIAAPVVSLLTYCLMGIMLSFANIKASSVTIVLPVTVILFIVDVAAHMAWKPLVGKCKTHSNQWDFLLSNQMSALYVIVGAVIGIYAFVLCLDGPNSVTQTYDNNFHYNLIRSFLNSGSWSIFSATLYPDMNATLAPFPSGSYYPAGWHILCTILVDSLGVSVGLASNATNFILASIVFPLSFGLLMSSIFKSKSVVACGSIVSLAFSAFPWQLVQSWPLFPNMASLALLPIVLVSFILMFRQSFSKKDRMSLGLLLFFSLGAMGCTQPNSVFSAVVFLAPFCVYNLSQALLHRKNPLKRFSRICICTLFIMGCGVAWVILMNAPGLQSVTSYYWPPVSGKAQTLLDIAGLSLVGTLGQPVLAGLVIAGIVGIVFCKREHFWIVVSYLIGAMIYFASASLGDNIVKHVLSGYWYTDPYRTAAVLVLYAIPLAAVGLYALIVLFSKALKALGIKTEKRNTAIPSILIAGLAAVAIFFPSFTTNGTTVETAFGHTREIAMNNNSLVANKSYDAKEEAFVEEAKERISEESVVINLPYDGSMLSYSISNLDVYYRYIINFDSESPGETRESQLIRQNLKDVASDSSVRGATQEIGAKYVLLLGRDQDQIKGCLPTYKMELWEGINAIDDNTPGFKVVLAQDDMRLYEIVA